MQAAFMKSTTAAMKQQDPQTAQLREEFEQKQAELQKLVESGGHAK